MTKRILFQGDSVTDCGRCCPPAAGYDSRGMGPGYPGLIASQLICHHPEIQWDFVNRGVSGDRIVDLYARWKRDAINIKPDILSILVGVNDCLHERAHQNGVEPERYELIYRMLLEWTVQKLPCCQIVLMEPFMIAPKGDLVDWIPDMDKRSKIVQKLSSDFGAIFIPTAQIFKKAVNGGDGIIWSADCVHPSPAGHRLIADAWLEAVMKELK